MKPAYDTDGKLSPTNFDGMRCVCGEPRAPHRRSPLAEDHAFEPMVVSQVVAASRSPLCDHADCVATRAELAALRLAIAALGGT